MNYKFVLRQQLRIKGDDLASEINLPLPPFPFPRALSFAGSKAVVLLFRYPIWQEHLKIIKYQDVRSLFSKSHTSSEMFFYIFLSNK